MLKTTRYIGADRCNDDRHFFRNSSRIFYHGDVAIIRVQQWLQTRAITQPTIPQMAAVGQFSVGTFVRRFRKATGLNPTLYNQRLRIEEACELMEFTDHSIDTIAGAVGYKDQAFFGKIFQRLVGVSPNSYRGRFAKAHLGKPPPPLEEATN